MEPIKAIDLLNNDGSDTTGAAIPVPSVRDSGRTMCVGALDGTGPVTSSVAIQGSHDTVHWLAIGTLTLSGTPSDVKSLAIDYPWPHLRAVSSTGSGTRSKLRVSIAI